MADTSFDQIDYFGKQTGLTPIERLPNLDQKRNAVAGVSAIKQANLMTPQDYYSIAAGVGNQLGAGSMGEVERDLRTLNQLQLAEKYGDQLAAQMSQNLGEAVSRFFNDQVGTRDAGSTTYDLTTGIAGGYAGSIADIGSFGVGLANDEFGAAMANQTAEYRKALEESQSGALNAARKANRAKNALSRRDNQLEYEQNIASGQSETLAKVERFLSDFGDTILNADDPTVLAQGTAEGVGSLFVAGPLAKGIKAGVTALVGKEAVQAAKVAGAISKAAGVAAPIGARAVNLLQAAALPVAIGTMEAGGTYSQTVNEIMSMQPEQLLQTSEEYRQKVAEYEAQGMLHEEALYKAQLQLASETGIKAAAIQFPAAVAAGLLTRYAEAPFKAASASKALTNIALAEPLEEAIQGTTGSVTQDIAIKGSVDPNRDIGKGAGEQAATSALYGHGAAGVAQSPGLAARGTGAVVGGTARAIGSGLSKMANASTNKRNAQLADETVAEANAAVDTSVADVAEMSAAVDSVDATPEQKEQAKLDLSSLQQAQQVDPNMDLEGVPDNLKAVVTGSKSRAEAIIRLAQEMGKAEDDVGVLQAAAVMNELLSGFDELKAKNNEVLAALPADDPAHQKYQKNLALIEKVRTNPFVKAAMDTVKAHIDKTAEQMTPISEAALATPEGQQQVKDIVTVASLAPNKGNLDAVNQVLQMKEDGKVPLTEAQIKALKNSKALLTAAKKLAEQKEALGLKRTRDIVSDEVISRDDTKNTGVETEKRSALEFTKRVYEAYKSGDYALAAAHLQEFGMFVEHMKRKVQAINTHYEKGAKVGILNRDKEDYQTLLPPEFTGGRVGTVSAKSIGLEGVFAAPTQADKIDLIQSIALEAEIVADIYNSLVDGYNLEGANPIEPASLDPELVGKPDEVVARYKATQKDRKAKPAQNEPTEGDFSAFGEEAVPKSDEQKANTQRADDLISRLEAVKEFIPAAYKGVKKLIDEGQFDKAEKWIADGERRATESTSSDGAAEASGVTDEVGINARDDVPPPTEEDVVGYVNQEEQADTVSEEVSTDQVETSEEFDESSLEDVFTTDQPALIEQTYEIVRQPDSKFDLNNGQKNAFQKVMGFLKGNTQIFSIIGSAGTGKTTIVDTVLASLSANDIKGRDIILSSPTHRANGVTRSKNDPGLEIVTLHNLLGLMPPEDKLPSENKKKKGGLRQRTNKDGEDVSVISNNSLIIVDEASMINDELFSALMKSLANYPNAKVIFLGDAAQLKPVKQESVSKALESDVVNDSNRAELTKVERAKNPSLLAESVRLRRSGDFTKTNRMTKDGQGVSFTKSHTVFVDMFVNYLKSAEFKSNPLLARIVAFSNNRVKEYNQKIRTKLYGQNPPAFVVGELLMGYKSYGEPNLITKLATINNGLDYLVTHVSEETKINYFGSEVKTVKLTIKHTLSYKNGEVFQEPKTITVLLPQDLAKVTQEIEARLSSIEAIVDDGKRQEAYKELKGEIAQVALPFDIETSKKEVIVSKHFDYGYAHTIHKSQGGTYKYVFVDNTRMDVKDPKTGQWSLNPDAPQLRYVGMTRAQEGAYILTNGNITQGKPYKGKADPAKDDPSVVVPKTVVAEQTTPIVSEPAVQPTPVTSVVQPTITAEEATKLSDDVLNAKYDALATAPGILSAEQEATFRVLIKEYDSRRAAKGKPSTTTTTTSTSVDEEVDFLQEIDTEGLVEPASDFVGPEKPTSLMSYFKNLFTGIETKITNYFHKSFVLPEEGKETSRLLGSGSPIEFATNLLFGSKERLEKFLGTELKYDLSPQTLTAYKKFLGTNAKDPKSFGGVLAAVNKNLASWLAEPNGRTNKDRRPRFELLKAGIALHTVKTGHALNILEEKDGKFSYNQELIEGAVLAAMQWLIESGDREVLLKDEEVRKLTGEEIENVSEEVIAQLKTGFSHDQIKMAIASKIKAYWGVRVAPGALQGYSDGIPEAVAAEIMQALLDTGFLKEQRVQIRVAEFDDEGNPILDENENQKEQGTDINRYTPQNVDEALKGYPTIIEEIAVTDPEQVIYLHDDEVPVAKTRMNNPQERNTKAQEKAIELSQQNKFFPNSHTIDAIFSIGEIGVAFLFGGGVVNLEDKPWYNINRKATIEGKNKTVIASFKALDSMLYRMESRAAALGIPVAELAVRYAVNASKNGRLFMLGSHNPQASKLMRIAMATTWSVLNLTNPIHMSNFKLAMGQALGIKVHNIPLTTIKNKDGKEVVGTIESVDALITKLEPAITRFQAFLGNKENGLDYEALARDFSAAGVPMTPASFNAVLEWSRSQMEGTDKSAFRTAVSLEADGITNGPVNSIMLLTQGGFTVEFVKNLMRGGISFSDAKSMAQLRLDHGLIDLYSESAKNAESAVHDSVEFFEEHNKEVSYTQKVLIRTMRTLLPNLSYTYDPDKKSVEFKFERSLLKNPLTITIYGSSANGIAGKMVSEVLDAYYDLLSQTSDRYANGVRDAEGNVIRFETVWEAMFPDMTAEEAKQTYDQLNKDFDHLTNSTVQQGWHFGNKVWSLKKFNAPVKTQKETPQSFTITPQQFAQLRGTMLHTFIDPMVNGINETLGHGLLRTVEQIKIVSQIQSAVYAQMFRNELDKLIKEREAEYKATGQNWKQNGFVSKEDIRIIVKKLNRFAPILRTGDQTFSLSKNEKLDRDSYAYSNSLFDRFSTSPNMNVPANAGVGAIPAIAIGFGDAFMIQDAVLSEVLERVLAVFDGVEMPLDKIEEFSEQLNKSVYESYKANPMGNLSTMFNTFLEGSEQIKELLLSEVQKVAGKDAKSIKDASPALYTLMRSLRKQPGMPYDMYKIRIPKEQKAQQEFVEGLLRAIEYQQASLSETAEDIDLRHQVMREVGMSVDQMAAGASPYYNGQPLLNTTNPKEIADILQIRYLELKAATAKAKEAREARKEKAAKPKSETSELGEKHPTGVRVLSWDAIQKLSSFLGLTKEQQLMYEEIAKTHADSGIVVITGSKAEIAKYRFEKGIPAVAANDNPAGEFVISSDGVPTVFLYEGKAETLVHELIHAATLQLMIAYYKGDIKKNTVAGKAMQNLEAMMQEFLAEFRVGSDGDVNAVIAAISRIENDTTKTEPIKKALKLNEFIAWTLANQNLAKKLQNKTLASKLLTFGVKILNNLRQLLGLNEKNTFLNNLQFNAAVIIHAAPTLRQQYMDVVMQHNPNPTKNPRLTRIREALVNNIINHVSKLYGQKKVFIGNPNASEFVESTTYSNYVADVFKLSDEERLVFQTFVIAMTTQGKLDSSILVRAQELYTHVLKDLDASKLADPNTTDTQVRESEGLPKLNILLGKAGFTDKADRTVLLSTFLGLAVVNDDFRSLLAKMPVPKTTKIPGKTLNAMATNLGNQMMDALSRVLTGEKNSSNVKVAIDNLTDQLHALTFHEQTRFEATVAKVGNAINQGNDWTVKKKDALAEKGTALGKKLGASNKQPVRVLGAAIRVASGIASSKEADITAQAAIENLNKMDFQFGKRTIIDVIGRTEKNASIYDLIKPVRSFVQQLRQQYREHIPQYIASKFTKVITNEQYASMFRALGKTDIAVLLSSMSVDDAVALFKSTVALDNQISTFEEKIRTADPANWSKLEEKMKQLANYMNTTVTGNGLLRNAEAVANLLNEQTKGVRLVDAALISNVDQLVTLYAIKGLNQKDKISMLSLAQQEPVGVKFIVDYLATQRKDELSKLNDVTKFNYFKGYIPSDPKEQGDVIVADNNKAAELAVYGYVKVGAYKAHPNDPDKSARSYYYSPVAQKAIVSQGIIQNVRHTVAGVDTSHGFSTGKTAGRITNPLVVKRIAQQLRDTNNVENLMPLFNEAGDLYAFERSIDPKMLEKLEQSQHIAKMIGVWRGRQVEEIESEKMNRKLVAVLKERWDAAKPSDRDQFVNLNDPRELTITEREAVKLFSSSMKGLIKETFGSEGFYVPKDMLVDVIGYRNASVGDFITGNTEWNAETQKAVRTVMLAAFGNKAFQHFLKAEQGIQSVMTDARQTIVIKSVIIPMYNIMSNMLHLVSRGVPIQMIVKGSLQKVSEINHYTRSKVRQTELEADLRAEKNELKRRRLEVELKSILDSHARMSIWPLIQAGEFSTIADVGMTAEDLELTSGKLSEWVERKIDKLPPALQTAAKYGYVSRDTALFKGLQKAVQYGDFVSKAVLFDHLTNNKGKTTEEALAQITEEFVNYDRLPGRARGALENFGLLWFYNYKLRTIKVALSVIRNNPLHAFIAMNLPVSAGVGTVVTDNLLGVAAHGNMSYSIGPSMALHAINLNPTVNLFN